MELPTFEFTFDEPSPGAPPPNKILGTPLEANWTTKDEKRMLECYDK